MAITPRAPINTGETPREKANWFEITDGTITDADGELIAEILSGGGDYLTRYVEDNVAEVDMRLMAKDTAGDLMRLTVTGFDYLDQATMLEVDGRTGEDPGNENSGVTEPYGLEYLKVNTASAKWKWLNYAVLFARVNFVVGAAGIESVVYTTYHVSI